MTKLLAFHNKQRVKTFYVKRIKLHAELDEIVKGTYWEGGRGCAVGCSIHGDDHADYETKLGIPESVARLEDGIFEDLPLEEAKAFPLQFIEAIPVGADLSKISRQMCVFALNQCLQYATQDGIKVIYTVLTLLRRSLDGDEPTGNEWSVARSAAWPAESATRSAAWSARSARSAESAAWSAESAAWSAAWSAESATRSARSATRSAAWSAAWSAWPAVESAEESAVESALESAESAWSAARIAQRDELLRLLRNAPVEASEAKTNADTIR